MIQRIWHLKHSEHVHRTVLRSLGNAVSRTDARLLLGISSGKDGIRVKSLNDSKDFTYRYTNSSGLPLVTISNDVMSQLACLK